MSAPEGHRYHLIDGLGGQWLAETTTEHPEPSPIGRVDDILQATAEHDARTGMSHIGAITDTAAPCMSHNEHDTRTGTESEHPCPSCGAVCTWGHAHSQGLAAAPSVPDGARETALRETVRSLVAQYDQMVAEGSAETVIGTALRNEALRAALAAAPEPTSRETALRERIEAVVDQLEAVRTPPPRNNPTLASEYWRGYRAARDECVEVVLAALAAEAGA